MQSALPAGWMPIESAPKDRPVLLAEWIETTSGKREWLETVGEWLPTYPPRGAWVDLHELPIDIDAVAWKEAPGA